MSYVETPGLVRWLGVQFMLGREAMSDFVQDFLFDHSDSVLKVRKLFINDVGDPGDMGFGRIGPDNASWDTPRQDFRRLKPGYNIGTWYWRAFVGETDNDPGVGFSGKNAQIYARAVGEQTPRSTGGSLHFGSTPVGELEPRDRVVIEDDGTLNLAGVPTTYSNDGVAFVRIRTSDGRVRKLRLDP